MSLGMNASASEFWPSLAQDNLNHMVQQMSLQGWCTIEENVSQEDLSELEAVDAWIADMVELDLLEQAQEVAMSKEEQ